LLHIQVTVIAAANMNTNITTPTALSVTVFPCIVIIGHTSPGNCTIHTKTKNVAMMPLGKISLPSFFLSQKSALARRRTHHSTRTQGNKAALIR